MSTNDFGKKFGPLGGAFMMSPSAGDAGAAIGLDFFTYYALGRGGVLGDVDGQTIADTFFFFNPDLVKSVWDAGKANNNPREVAANYAEACAAWGRATLSEVEGLDDFCKLAQRVAEMAEPTPSSALFDAWREATLPDDPAGRAAIHCILVLREHRGGAHVEAIKQVGLAPTEAVAANSPHMYELFGWTDEMPNGERFKAQTEEAERITEELVAPAYEALDESERDRFGSILTAIAAAAGR
jgi:hypothetical protein